MAKLKSKAIGPVPQSKDECRGHIRRIGDHQRERDRIQTRLNDAVAKLQEKFGALATPHNEQIAELSKGVQAWAEAHRDELTSGGKKKTVDLGTGEILWRITPPSVRILNATGVIQALKDLALGRFVRTKEEVNREAILAEPEAVEHIKGITVSQREEFIIKPAETDLEEVA